MNNMVYPLLPLPGKKGISNMIRSMKITNIKDIKYVLLNLMIFYDKKKNVYKKHDKQKSSKGNLL